MTDGDAPTVKDPEEYIQERRLREILDARSELRDHRLRVQQAAEKDEFEAVSAYRMAVSNYLMEVQPLMERFEPGPELLYEREFGVLRIDPNVFEKSYHQGRDALIAPIEQDGTVKKYHVAQRPEPVRHELDGLVSIYELPNPVRHVFELESVGHGSQGTVHQRVTVQPQMNQIDRMVRAINSYLAEIGFEAVPDDGTDEWEI